MPTDPEQFEQARAEIYEVNRIKAEQNNLKFRIFMMELQQAYPDGYSSSDWSEDEDDDPQLRAVLARAVQDKRRTGVVSKQ
jgi:hypothetical protein